MDDAMMLPASDTSLAWVYEGATPAMTPGEAATAIQAATLGWTQDDHLQMGALQHHLAVGLGDDPERQAVCSAAAYMHVAAAGLDPGSLLNKGLDPKVLRPKLGTKPEQIGKTRSGKPIYNMFTHPAHASFTTADHVDHIEAMAAHSKAKKMNKAGTPPKLSVVQHAGPKTPGGHPILHSEHPSYAHPIYNHRAKAGTSWGDEEKVKHQTLKDFSHYSAADHDAAHTHHHALGLKQKAAGGEQFQAGLKSSGISAGHQLAASHLRGLQKIKENPGKSSEWHAGQMGGLRGGNQEHFESHRAASIHLRNMGKSMSALMIKSGEGSRGGKILRHTAAGAPVYAPSEHNGFSIGKTSSGVPVHHDGSYLDIKSKKEFVDASRLHGAKAAYHRQKAAKIVEGRQGNFKPSSALSAHERLMNEHERHSQQFMNLAKLAKSNAAEGDMYKSEAVSILEDFLAKSGEGSRGGKIIGRTRSGKPVYASAKSHSSHYSEFTASDHADAASLHSANHSAGVRKMIARGLSLADAKNQHKTNLKSADLAVSHAKAAADGHSARKSMSKSGEGSRGGNVNSAQHQAEATSLSGVAEKASKTANGLGIKNTQAHLSAHTKAFVAHRRAYQAHDAIVNRPEATSHYGEMMKHAKVARRIESSLKGDVSKSGEGSRGGKVIGHTKSQKPIYASSDAHEKAKSHVSQLNYKAAGKTMANHYPDFTSREHGEAAVMHGSLGQAHLETAHHHAAMYLKGKGRTAVRKSEAIQNSAIMGFPVDLGDMNGSPIDGSPIDGSYVDSMGGSHDLFMQQAELANCPTMWAPIATVPEN